MLMDAGRHCNVSCVVRAPGFTLIEVLLALVLSGVVISLSGQVAVQTLRIDRSVERQIVSRIRTHHVADAIAADLAAAFDDAVRLDAVRLDAVRLEVDPNGRPRILINCLAARPTDTPYLTRLPAQVTYRLVRMDNQRLRLERTVAFLAGDSASAVESTVARDLAVFTVLVWQDQRWQLLDANLVPKLRTIEAFRVELTMNESQPYAWTFPVGQALTHWRSPGE